MVSARTVGQDGLAAESAPPDRVIDVRVKRQRVRWVRGSLGWLVALAIGAVIGRFGDPVWTLGAAVLKKVMK